MKDGKEMHASWDNFRVRQFLTVRYPGNMISKRSERKDFVSCTRRRNFIWLNLGGLHFGNEMRGRIFEWTARIEWAWDDFSKNEPIKNEKFRRESPKGNDNNGNAVDVGGPKMWTNSRHATIQFRTINQQTKKSNHVVGVIESTFFSTLAFITFFFKHFESSFGFYFFFLFFLGIRIFEKILINEMSKTWFYLM